MSFENFIYSLQLNYFQPYEFLIDTDQPGNRIPPERIWDNIVVTALLLDKLRAEFGRPLVLTSCYRSPEYNQMISGSAPLSQHQAFAAVDFFISGVSPSSVARSARYLRNQWIPIPIDIRRRPVRVPAGYVPFWELPQRWGRGQLEVMFLGGVSEYDQFVHLDTRGQNVNWG
jgi:hypothetical protein